MTEQLIKKPRKFFRQPDLPKDFWLSKIGQRFHYWELVKVDKRSLRSPAMRQILICKCTRCNRLSRLKAYSVWQGRTTQCQHCKRRKIWPERKLKGAELKLYFIWNKFHNLMIPEWKEHFEPFRDYCLKNLNYVVNRKMKFSYDKSKPIGPGNLDRIPFSHKKSNLLK